MTLAERPRTRTLESATEHQSVREQTFAGGYANAEFVVTVEYEDGRFVATTDVLPMYGEGDSQNAALMDLLASMESLREQLRQGTGHLSPELAEQLARLEALGIATTY